MCGVDTDNRLIDKLSLVVCYVVSYLINILNANRAHHKGRGVYNVMAYMLHDFD